MQTAWKNWYVQKPCSNLNFFFWLIYWVSFAILTREKNEKKTLHATDWYWYHPPYPETWQACCLVNPPLIAAPTTATTTTTTATALCHDNLNISNKTFVVVAATAATTAAAAVVATNASATMAATVYIFAFLFHALDLIFTQCLAGLINFYLKIFQLMLPLLLYASASSFSSFTYSPSHDYTQLG